MAECVDCGKYASGKYFNSSGPVCRDCADSYQYGCDECNYLTNDESDFVDGVCPHCGANSNSTPEMDNRNTACCDECGGIMDGEHTAFESVAEPGICANCYAERVRSGYYAKDEVDETDEGED